MMIPKLGLLARRRSSKGTHKELLVIFLLLCQTSRATQPSQKLIGTSAGDVTIGALFPVHEAPDSENAQSRICGRIREQYGIHRVEAAFQVLDEINNNQELLPNITLGIEIRDSCWYPPKALEQSIEFIRDTIAMRDDANGTSGTSPTGEKCTRGTKNTKNIVGIIGPGSSAVTIQVQNLLQLFNIPQIGYSATSRELSRKDFYKYFLRVVPSDEFQSKLMVDVLLKLNWSYVITVNSEGNYGNSGMEVFHTRAKEAGICVATTAVINHNAPFAEYELLLKSLDEFPNAKVIVCFCEGYTVRSLLNATAEMGLTGKFVIFGSDGWSDRMDVVSNLENHAQGSISVRLHTNYDMEFDNYFFKLNPFNNTRNPWFREFWEDRFDCSFNTTRAAQGVRMCTGTEKLGQKGTYKQDTKLEFVKKSIYTMAHGLHNMHKHFCPNHTGLCSAMLPINGSILLQHLFQVRFQYGDDVHSNESRVFFMDNGDPPGHYDIMNFQKNGDKYDYVQVGAWNDGELNLSGNIQWNYNWNLSEDQTPVSICSMPCPKGQVKNVHSETLKCCWTCTECRKNEILVDEFTCKACALGFFPNDNLTDCEQIKIEHLHWDDSESIVATSIAVGGIVLTVLVMVVFLTNHNTPIVKSSTRELSYIIMLGMLFSHVTTFVLLAYPTCERCMAARLIPGLSFSIIYSALAIKNKRIADCFRRSHKMKMEKESSSHFTSLKQQLIGIGITIAIEGTCCFIFLTLEPPDAVLTYPDVSRVVIDCNTTTQGLLFPLAYPCGLLGVCTYFAFQTRNIPGNFSEAKLIGFTVYTTIVIWIAFVAIYFGSKHKVISMCICTSLASLVCLIVLFMPRTYNILFEKKSNVRSRFAATNPELRMHVGNSNVSRNSSTGDNNPSGRTHSTENRTNAPEQKGLTTRFLRGLKCWSTKQDARELRRVQQADINRKARQLDMDQRARHRDHGDATSRPTPSAEEPSVGPSGYCGRKSSPDRQDPERERRVETGVQTTDDLLESLGPRLRKRIRSELDLHERPDLLNQECLHTERLTEVMETGWMSNPTRPHSRELTILQRGDYGTELAGVGEIYPEIIEDDDATLAGEDIEETQDEPSPVRGSCQPYGVIQRSRDGPSIIEESVSSNGDESSSGDYKRIIINIGLGGTRRGPGSGLVSGPGPVNAPRLREFPPVEEFPELPETPGINPVCPVHGNWAEVSAQELLHEYRDNQHHRGPRHDYHEHSHGGGEHGRHPPSRRRSSIWSCRNGCGHYHVRPHSHDRDGRDRYLPRRTGSRHDEPHRKGI